MRASAAVFRAQARYWRRHRLQASLALLGIALGVAVFTAVRLANAGALAAFAQGVEAFAGRATHRVYSPEGAGVPEAWFPRLAALPHVGHASPLLRGGLRVTAGTQPRLTVLGIDPLSDAALRDFTFLPGNRAGAEENPGAGLERFLRIPGAVALPQALAEELGLGVGDALPVRVEGAAHALRIVGVFQVPARYAEGFARTAVLDISSHQELFGRRGRLDEIQLVLDDAGAAEVQALLPPALALEPVGGKVERVDRMSRAFRLNLEALGLFALLVAAFLIYNTATFSVVQREHAVAVLRCLGAPMGAVCGALLLEAAVLGAAGGALGVLAGRWLGGLLVRGTSATLFEVILETDAPLVAVRLTAETWAVGLALGIAVSACGALVPALEAARVSPLAALRGVRGPGGARRILALWTGAGLGLLGLAALLLGTGTSLLAGLIGATALVIGGALLSPAALWLASRALSPLLERTLGVPGLLAGRNLERSLARTGMATASLLVALSLALAIEITVHSFRHTFELWLTQAITADLYVAPAAEGRTAPFPQGLAERLRALPEVRDVAELKSRRVTVAGREVLVVAIQPDVFARTASLPMLDAAPAQAMDALRRGAALVSETLALPLDLQAGGAIALPGRNGPETLPIAAVVQNYSVPGGLVYLDVARFTALFGPVPTRQVALWLAPGAGAEAVRRAIDALPEGGQVRVNANAQIRREALRIFDRTFAITQLMGALAAFVAFVAVVSALLALLEERIRILGYLRAIGVSRRRLGASLALEAALLALVAGVLSWGVGLLAAAVLVFVVNRRAFGWTLQFLPGTGSYGQLLLLAVLAALLGSLYPIHRATRLSVAATIREE